MQYTEPGNISELTDEQREKWVQEVSSILDVGVDVAKDEADGNESRVWFYNPIKDGGANQITKDIDWSGFPKPLLDTSGSKQAAWRAADRSRDEQIEYCEWEIVRNSANKLVRVTVTTETPDYYEFLFEEVPDLLLSLYKKYVSPNVTLSDLTVNGKYSKSNKWNRPELQGKRGVIMHMSARPNTWGAAVNLAAEATWPTVDRNGSLITDEQGFIACRRFGDSERHSDPHIGAQVNELTRQGLEVSLSGPPGLYINKIDTQSFETPDGSNPLDWFRVVRGDSNYMMRLVFEAPSNSGHILQDLKIDGRNVVFGGQIMEKIKVRLTGVAQQASEAPFPLECGGTGQDLPAVTSLNGSRRINVNFISSNE